MTGKFVEFVRVNYESQLSSLTLTKKKKTLLPNSAALNSHIKVSNIGFKTSSFTITFQGHSSNWIY